MVSTAVRGSLGVQFDDSNLQPGASFLDHRFAEAPRDRILNRGSPSSKGGLRDSDKQHRKSYNIRGLTRRVMP